MRGRCGRRLSRGGRAARCSSLMRRNCAGASWRSATWWNLTSPACRIFTAVVTEKTMLLSDVEKMADEFRTGSYPAVFVISKGAGWFHVMASVTVVESSGDELKKSLDRA